MNIRHMLKNIRVTITIAFSKLTIKVCRALKMGGTTLPGKIAHKICPDILKLLSQGFKVIMVTGTNGKTTTTKIIGRILEENKIDFITNKSGANLLSGITTTFIESVDLKGKSKIKTALIEIDEAAFKKAADFIKPHTLVVTNFFRDQLDRYGELYNTLKGVASGIEKTEKTRLILNGDDSLCASLGRNSLNKVIYFGIDEGVSSLPEESINTDALFCIYCKEKYEYTYHTYGHLGGFKCPKCDYKKPETQVKCFDVLELTSSHSKIKVNISKPFKAKINLPGLYNVYNALAASACGQALGLPDEKTIKALESFECGFGRMETIEAYGKKIKLILVKNPTGFNQVINYLLTEQHNFQLAFAINDKLADGRDISWLWDVDFEKLQHIQEKTDHIYTTGIRAEDMAVRLKYAGIYTDKISIYKDYKMLINTGLSRTQEDRSFYILPTYTAMLDIRKVLKKMFNLKEFWK